MTTFFFLSGCCTYDHISLLPLLWYISHPHGEISWLLSILVCANIDLQWVENVAIKSMAMSGMVIPTLGKQRKEDFCEFETFLGYVTNSQPVPLPPESTILHSPKSSLCIQTTRCHYQIRPLLTSLCICSLGLVLWVFHEPHEWLLESWRWWDGNHTSLV